jgi:hypothetical protein
LSKRKSGMGAKRGTPSRATGDNAKADKALQDARAKIKAIEAELEAFRQRARDLERDANAAEQESSLSKREAVKAAAWVAPIVIAVNLPDSVFAASSPVAAPTSAPTAAPTSSPTAAPTASPTGAPSFVPTPGR